ncbi:protoheme IX farnesyltransferase [Desulfobaculum xiamenense]|uniref:Protoheme IX farnesyltransferase n=1 Tax=Desulfobaculum xiamenense TaxID=995050 RepID=A0A846QI14_9BACT|nr:protoheme IX farnesyltransferase [Desulfobaculum xiamenense]NJB67831.1 protoheme IX farnesyltransferase [Desulfobaculum xiamenense]
MRDVVALVRPRISAMVAGAAAFGYLLAGNVSVWRLVGAVGGAFFLCAGCSALNQVQEWRIDARMSRTASRPVASGRMTPAAGAGAAALTMGLGAGLYWMAGGALVLAVCAGVVALYNGLYTPLKRHTSFAVLVGGVAGALPPYTGWLCAGGEPLDTGILGVGLMIYLWQVPHFWMLAELHREDFAAAGLPVTPLRMPRRIFNPLMYLWVVGYFTAALALPVLVDAPGAALGVTAASAACGVGVGLCGMWGRTGRAMVWLNASLPLVCVAVLLGL